MTKRNGHKRARSQHKVAANPDLDITQQQREDIQALLNFCGEPRHEGYELARAVLNEIINRSGEYLTPPNAAERALFLLCMKLSTTALEGYATLDAGHIDSIDKFTLEIKKYVRDPSRKRPLNFLMLAEPGAGKSHFIKCIAKKLEEDNVRDFTFNMAALQNNEDLIPALDGVRNLKVGDHMPLLFLDEFDSNPNHLPLLLPLLWDGELVLGQRDLKLGRAIIVLAGSSPTLPHVMEQARNMRAETQHTEGSSTKIVDLLSRINGGVVQIPPFGDPNHKNNRQLDKACIAVQLLRRRFGEKLATVPLALLRFVVHTQFRYGVRSIDYLLEQIPCDRETVDLEMGKLQFPMQAPDPAKALKASSLAYHVLHEEQVGGILDVWTEARKIDAQLPIITKFIQPRWWLASARDMEEIVAWFIDRVAREHSALSKKT